MSDKIGGNAVESSYYLCKRCYHTFHTEESVRKHVCIADFKESTPSASSNMASAQCLCETCGNLGCEGLSCKGPWRPIYTVSSCSGFTKS